jgi:prolyl oligopeptidase
MRFHPLLLCALALSNLDASAQTTEDPYGWLDDVEGHRAVDWVAAHNGQTLALLQALPVFDTIYDRNLEIHRARERLSTPEIRGEYTYELWQDGDHQQGLWRRTPLDSWVSGDPDWEVLLDVDSLAEAEGQDWSLVGEDCAPPEYTRCLVALSRGGQDAGEVREFDVEDRAFVEGGFFLPEVRSSYAWKDANTLLVATNFGEGTTTDFGWPRIVKQWERGASLDAAAVLFESESSGARAFPVVERGPDRSYVLIVQEWLARQEYQLFALEDGRLVRLEIPPWVFNRIHPGTGQLTLILSSDWTHHDVTYSEGTLLAIDYGSLLLGDPEVEVVVRPAGRSRPMFFQRTESSLIVHMLSDDREETLRFRRERGQWVQEEGTASDLSFLEPPRLDLVRGDGTVVELGSQEPEFDVAAFTEHRYEARSRDGTAVPYFIVHPRDLELDGRRPTLLYGYGGYGEPMLPGYDPILGTAWLERGGVYVLAQIRGGGEFGPAWHEAALRENRQRAFDDFIAVAEDLIARRITSPEHLGIMGRSNGGLLVGAVLTQRPDLFGAVACLNPVLDLSKAHELPDAGAEFGDPRDPRDWAYLERLSPYHNLSRHAPYPKVLFMTSRTDDRVGPGHARRMAARMEDLGHAVYFYESETGGHLGIGSLEQQAFRDALVYTYLLSQLR